MDTKEFMDTINKHIDKGFNINNQLVEYVANELNQMDANISTEQAQHIINIIEYISKSTTKNTVTAIVNSLLELGILSSDK